MVTWLKACMRSPGRRRKATSGRHSSEVLENRTLLAAFSWNTDADGLWNDPANWVGGTGIPGAGDTVTIDRGTANPVITVSSDAQAGIVDSAESIVIDASSTFTVSGSSDFASVHLQSGRLNLRASTTIHSEFVWEGGGLDAAALTIADTASLNIESAADKWFAGSLANAGTIYQEVPVRTPARNTEFTNLQTGDWTVEDDFHSPGGFSIVFSNQGTFRKTGSLSSAFGLTNDRFDHLGGTVDVQEGTLTLNDSGNGSNPSTGATFNVAAGATLNLNTGRSYFVGNYTGSGAGRVELSEGVLDVSHHTGGTGATFDFPEGLFHWTGGTITGDGTGGDAFINNGHMTWSGSGSRSLLGQEIRNRGTIVQTDDGVTGFNSGGQGTWFYNEAGALFEHTGTGGVISGRIINGGVIRNSAGDAEFQTVLYANDGSVFEVTDGQVRLTKGGEFQTAEFRASGSGVLKFEKTTGGNFELMAGATVTGTGDGQIEFSAGRFESVGSDAVIDFAHGLFHWTGGDFFRDITNAGHITISGAAPKKINNSFTNTGTVIHTAGTFVNSSSAGFLNTAGALWEMQGDASFGGQSFVTAKFRNAGILRKTGPGTAEIFDGGVALSHQGGTVDIRQGSLNANHSGNAEGTGGHLIVAAGSTFDITGKFDSSGRYTGEGAGHVNILAEANGGLTLDFPQGMATMSMPNADDTHDAVNDGYLTIEGAGQQQQFGWFRNNGTVVQTPGTEIQMRNYSQVVNHGLWELQGDAFIDFHSFDGRGAYFSNFGTLRKNGPIATSTISGTSGLAVFNNSGTVDVVSGTLQISELNLKQFQASKSTLYGGTWSVGEFSTLELLDSGGETPDILTNLAHVTLDGTASGFPNMDSLTVNGGHFEIRHGRDFTTEGDLTNGAEFATSQLLDVIQLTTGRFVGLALDANKGRLISHARNERIDGEPIFRISDIDGSRIADPIVQPGGPVDVSGIDVTTVPLNVGGTTVPAGSLLFIHGNVAPPTLYALNINTGAVLASVELPDVLASLPGVAQHPTRGTVFVVGRNSTVTEINAADGSTINSFSATPSGSPFFSLGTWGGMDINGEGNVLLIGSQRRLRELTPTGDFVHDVDLIYSGMARETLSDLSYDDATGEIWIASENGSAFRFSPVELQAGELRVGPDSTLTVPNLDSQAGTVGIDVGGRPASGDFGRLEVTGTADFTDGTVDVGLADGFGPITGDMYEVIAYAGQTGLTQLTGLDPFFSAGVSGTAVTLNALTTAFDLAAVASGFVLPATAVPGEELSVTYTGRNMTTNPLTTTWTDSLYLSRDLTLSQDDLLFGRREHTGGVGSLADYQETVTATFPGVADGPWFVLVVVDSRGLLADSDRANNFAAATTPVQSQANTLTFGTPVDSTIHNGQDIYFRLDVNQPGNVFIDLDLQTELQAEFYVSHRKLPTRSDFDFHSPSLKDLQRLIKLVSPVQGPWYVWLHGLPAAGAGEDFMLSADRIVFAVDDISPTRGDTSGTALITINGSGFTPDSVVELLDANSNPVASGEVTYFSADTVSAKFDLTALAAGQYTVQVTDALGSATAQTAFDVTTSNPGRLSFRLIGTGRIRSGGSATGWLEYTNVGGGDVDSPLLILEAEGGVVRRLDSAIPGGEVLALLALGNVDGSARTVVAPGETVRVPIRVTAESSSVVVEVHTLREKPIPITIYPSASKRCNCISVPIVIPAPDPFQPNWAAQKDDLRPSFIAPEAWDAIYPNFLESVGTDIGDFEDMLRQNANYLSSIGYEDLSVDALITFEMQRASNWGELVARNYTGSMGRGVPGPGDVRLTFDADEHATLQHAWGRSIYLFDGNRYVAGNPLDQSTLLPDGTGWQIRQQSGNRQLFDENGRLIRTEDAGGVGVTFSIIDGQTVSATQDNGDGITYDYDQNGLVTRAIYPGGQMVDFTYDVTNQYLLSAASGQNQITLNYVTQGPRSALHAIQSVTVNGGAEYQYTYDARGRLITERTAGGEIAVQYRYDQPGSVTVVYLDGTEFTQQVGLFGESRRSIDPLGQLTSFVNDKNGLVTSIVDAAGFRTEFERDETGSITRSVDSNGNDTQYSYDTFGDLFVLQDAKGHSTAFVNNAQGNLETVTYQDGSQEYFQYGGQSELVQSTNRNGDNVFWSYDNHGRLTGIEYGADGSTKTFVYNQRNYLVSATNSYGTLQFAYDQFDNLTRVDYPGGRFVEYTYDNTGRRLRTSDSGGTSFTYVYDAIGRLDSVVNDAVQPILSYAYDQNGEVSRIDNANGTSTRLTYDDRGRVLTQNTHAADDSMLWQYEYTYDAVGNIATMQTNAGLWKYTYDPTGQLITVTEPGGALTSYTYDEVGNRVAVQGALNKAYVSDEMNRYRSAGQFSYTYDESGNVIGKTDGSQVWSYTWGANGRLTGVDGPDGTFQYEYDALDQQVAITRNGIRTEWLSDVLRQTPLSQFDAGGNRLSGFVTATGLAAEITADNSLEFFAFDAIGNTVGITSSTGSAVNEYAWMPFGESVQATESRENLFQFGGGFGLTTTGDGLVRMGYRHYDPQVGRFMSEDPIGFQGGDVNNYRYARNQPNVIADPSGLQPIDGVGGSGDNNNNNNFYNKEKKIGKDQDQLNSEQVENGQKAGQKNHIETNGRGKPLVDDDISTIKFDADVDDGVSEVNLNWGNPTDEFEDEAGRRLRKNSKKLALQSLPIVGTVIAGIYVVHQVSEIDSVDEGLDVLKEEGLSAIPGYDSLMLGLELEKIGPDGILELSEAAGQSVRGQLLDLIGPWAHDAQDFADYYGDWDNRGAWLSALTFGWYVQTSNDPNDIIGPAGVGDENYITGEGILPYTIRFENLDTADAPAAEVFITQQLDSDLDWTTFELTDIGFGETVIEVPAGLTSWQTRLDLTETLGIWLDVDAGVDLQTGLASWTFRSIDPVTGDLPDDPLIGFLPPNMMSPEGEGFVSYLINADADVPNGARLDAEARIIFDTNEPIDTPLHFNKIDYVSPTSHIKPLPTESVGMFQVELTADDTSGSGAATFDIFVSTDGGPFELWADDAESTTLDFLGDPGHTYAMYSVATDAVGNSEDAPLTPDTVTVVIPPSGNVDGDTDFDANDSFLIHLVKLSGSDAQIDQSKGTSPLTAAEIRANVNRLGSTGDVDGDQDTDANDSFLMHLVKLSGSNVQIDQSKGSSPLTAEQIRANINGLGSGAGISMRRAQGAQALRSVLAHSSGLDVSTSPGANAAILAATLPPSAARDMFPEHGSNEEFVPVSLVEPVQPESAFSFAGDEFRQWIDAI